MQKMICKTGTAILIMAVLASVALIGCGTETDDGGGKKIVTPRYQTVPYSQISSRSAVAGKDYEVVISAFDATHNYYVLYLGYVNRVPLLFRDAVSWYGVPANGISVGFSREEATEEMVSNSITTAFSETVSKNQELNYGVKAGFEASAEGGFLGMAKVGWKASVEATVGGSTTWGNESTRSRENTIERAISKSTGTSDSLEIAITGDDPYGKYRYTLFGTTDVYLVLQTSKNPQSLADITDFYLSYCGRGDTYSWGVDYDPDENGTFKKNVSNKLLGLPDLDFSDFDDPITPVTAVQIPKPAAPTADPRGGTYIAAVDVTLSCVNEGSKIYYTTNASDPSASSTLYTGPIKISNTGVLKAVAIRDGAPNSDIMTETYTITPGRAQSSSYTGHTISRANGGTITKVQGDGNIDTKSGKNTDWDIEVTLTPRNNNVVASFTYHVKEKGGDNSILRLTQDVIIQLNKSEIQIDYPYNNYYKSGTITGQQHSYVTITPQYPVGGPIYSLSVKIDDSGSDEANIAAAVWLNFSYTYQP